MFLRNKMSKQLIMWQIELGSGRGVQIEQTKSKSKFLGGTGPTVLDPSPPVPIIILFMDLILQTLFKQGLKSNAATKKKPLSYLERKQE